MSSKAPSTLPTGISKSAAKKKAKKAKAQVTDSGDFAPNEVLEQAAADPSLFNFPPGAYPVDIQYDTGTYYDDTVPPANGNDPFSLPFPFDYSNLPPPLTQPPYGTALTQIASSFNITHEDLFSTAAELYKRMGDSTFGSDDPYWSSLSPHVKQFIRQAMPFAGSTDGTGATGANGSSRDMYDFAHKIVNAASQSMGLGQGVAANLLNGRPYTQPGLGDEIGFHRHPDAKEEEYDDEEDFDVDEPEYAATNGDAPKKKNKKKKKKPAAEPPLAQLPPPAIKQPPRQRIPPQPVQPALNPPPPPITPAPLHPPPSSRAAGKQPMGHAPVPAAAAPARSARAAGKAPAPAIPAHNHNHHNHPPPAKPAVKGKTPANAPPAKIWAQSSAEDRENIRHFWHGLNEAERRDLVQIEKDAVLRKLKEQHRHSCGCAVCGRKKVSIEHEVDQLYDQYLHDLGSYTAEQRAAVNGRQPAPPGAGPFPGSVEVDATGQITKYDHRAPDPKAIPPDDLIGAEESDEYDEEDEYDDEDELDEDDVGSDEADAGDDLDETLPPPQPPSRQIRKPPTKAIVPRPDGADDFLSFSSNLATIKGGILTVADDLLKNDGSKFLEMMEQLAVARHVREEQNIRDLEETEEEDYDEKEEPISEAERMEEGKRMFQIFAARMFEQRVLQAYREKVAKQREEQLLRELEEEEDTKRAKEEKKAKESQKKKDKKKMQKQRLDEEKAAKDAAVAAEQYAARAKAEDAERERQKKLDEERSRREAVKRAAQEEQLRIAADRRKRQQEEKEREEEAAKKKREREEKARKERAAREKEAKDKERSEKEERAAKEKAEKEQLAKEKAEKAERDRLGKEARDRAERERLAKLEEDRVERARLEEVARKEREAAEQAKILVAQQVQRERAAALEKAAAEKTAQEKLRAAAPVPVRARTMPRNGPTPQTTPPLEETPLKVAAFRQPVARPQKTPQPFFPQPVPAASYPARMPPQPFMPSLRAAFPSQSPVFSPPQANGSSTSPNPPTRGFQPESSPPSFDIGSRSAPIGMGFPPVKANRMASVDESFSLPTAPIGSNPRNISGDLLDDFRREPAPFGSPGPIGRPATYLDAPSSSTSTIRSSSPAPPEQVFGSAALGADDEIVEPARRNVSNGWDAPVAAAPGTGRWSASPSIWGSTSASDGGGSSWGAPGVPARQPSFGGIGSIPTPFSASGQGGFPGLFSPPGQQPPPQQHHSHH